MKLGRRAPEPVVEQPTSPQGTYRVAVAHTDPGHPCAVKSHWGPAYDPSFAATAAHVLDAPVESIDLQAEAEKGAGRARDEYGGMDGWEVWVERLDGDKWERVS